MAAIYLFAFGSLYVQIPGLYGDSGLLPAKSLLRKDAKASSFEMFLRKPTLLWFIRDLGLTTQTGMSFLCIIGICLGVLGIARKAWRDFTSFLTMWFLYFSLYQVGQTFLWFQWDILLLEAGFLCLLVAPKRKASFSSSAPHDSISMWLVKWLLFRLMFASGVVKLTSGCPTWWGLTALNWHYESQCIPTPLAWFAHQFPDWFQRFSVAMTFVIEGPIPFLFFAPIRSLRIFAFYLQLYSIALELYIYNPLHFTTITTIDFKRIILAHIFFTAHATSTFSVTRFIYSSIGQGKFVPEELEPCLMPIPEISGKYIPQKGKIKGFDHGQELSSKRFAKQHPSILAPLLGIYRNIWLNSLHCSYSGPNFLTNHFNMLMPIKVFIKFNPKRLARFIYIFIPLKKSACEIASTYQMTVWTL
ncbi:lipase maturation factor 2-like [Paramuricea clavata]|nr:lipase maturation factor 2-like [Paramuricea clavata]